MKESGYTWYFIYTIDPDGTLMNEGWFRGELSIKKYFLNYYRPAAERMIDWTFPVEYLDFVWDKPLPETEILMSVIDKIKPDLAYPLHNSGFGGVYFLSTRKFDEQYYENIEKFAEDLEIPLHLGEPEEDFMKAIKKPFYFDFGFKEYYEREIKLGHNPSWTLHHGDNSTSYILRANPNAVVIKGEIPYFYDHAITNTKLSSRTRREVWLEYIENLERYFVFYARIVSDILTELKEPDLDYYLMRQLERRLALGTASMLKDIQTSPEYDCKATWAEIFEANVGIGFSMGLTLGQLRRAAIKANLPAEIIKEIESKINQCARKVDGESHWEVFPIKKLVQLQVLVLTETLEALKRLEQ